MSRRKTVQLNLPVVLSAIKKNCRSNVVFCERMGRSSGKWVSDWQRTPAKNLPSPEEAARMCALLQVEPEEIIATPEDIALVRDLIEQEREAQKKDTTPQGDVSKLPKDIQSLIAICEENPALASALLAVARQIETHPSAQE